MEKKEVKLFVILWGYGVIYICRFQPVCQVERKNT